MYIVCKYKCYICESPLNIRINSNNSRIREIIREYRIPLYLYNNRMFLKSFTKGNPKMRRVCYSCFTNKISFNSMIRDRECGIIKNVKPVSLAKTTDEILTWFKLLERYVKFRIREETNLSNREYNQIRTHIRW